MTTMPRARWLAAALWLLCAAVAEADRRVAVILDTSGSMDDNDRPRYTVQISKILSDLLESSDELTVIHMPDDGGCRDGASSALATRFTASDRRAFKRRLDASISYDGGTHFTAPVRTAIEVLTLDPDSERMLLVIADSQGAGPCEDVLTRELDQLRRSGAIVSAINLGSARGAFDGNRAFSFTTHALDAEELIEAVALVYQRFLGAKRIQTGRVDNLIEVDVAPLVEDAFLVVAADGPMTALEQASGNPAAQSIDLDHRGGGETRGLDRRTRGYRIVRLRRPGPGTWRFRVPGLSAKAGWMLIQDLAIGMRLKSPPQVAQGAPALLEVELVDERTGRRITDLTGLEDLEVTVEIDGRRVRLKDDGTGGDRQAGDAILSTTTTFDDAGYKKLPVRLESGLLDRIEYLETEVVRISWRMGVLTPERAEAGGEVPLEVELTPFSPGSSPQPPQRVDALTGGPVVELLPQGPAGGEERNYRGSWIPRLPGTVFIDYQAVGGDPTNRVNAPLEVTGRLQLGEGKPIALGEVAGGDTAQAALALSGAEVTGAFDLEVTSDFEIDRTVLELQIGGEWRRLGKGAVTVPLESEGPRAWPLRLRANECPGGEGGPRTFKVRISGVGPDGTPHLVEVPLTVQVTKDPWLHCWWELLVILALLVAAAIIVHGILSSSRFPRRLGLKISTEEDLSEGFFHPIRARRGVYRDARIFLMADYRLSPHSKGAVARLRAHGKQVRIQPVGGTTLWRSTVDGTWEQLPAQETTARFGIIYRDELSSLFFDLRTG